MYYPKNCIGTLENLKRRKGRKKPTEEILTLEYRKPPADGEQRDASLFTVSSWVSFCFASFLPLKSDIPGWVVCPCPCGDPGMVMCSALHYLWSLASAQVGGEELNTPRGKKAEF